MLSSALLSSTLLSPPPLSLSLTLNTKQVDELQRLADDHARNIETLRSTNAALRDDVNAADGEIKDAESSLTNAQKRVSHLAQTADSLQRELQEARERGTSRDDTLRTTLEQLDSVKRRATHLASDNASQAESLGRIKMELEAELKEGAEYRAKCGQLEVDNGSLTRAMKRLEEDKKEMERSLDKMMDECEGLKSEAIALRGSERALQKRLSKKDDAIGVLESTTK